MKGSRKGKPVDIQEAFDRIFKVPCDECGDYILKSEYEENNGLCNECEAESGEEYWDQYEYEYGED